MSREATNRTKPAGSARQKTLRARALARIKREVEREVVRRRTQRQEQSARRATTVYDVHGPRLLMSFCAMMDVLGFNDRTRHAFERGKGIDFFSALCKAIGEAARAIKDDTPSERPVFWTHKFFTDNLLLAFAGYTLQSDGRGEEELGDVLMDVIDYQLVMSLHGFFVRGGLAFGPLHVSDEIVFGLALLDAHDIESKKAIYPRVVLSDAVVQTGLRHLKFYYPPTESPHDRTLLVADDNCVFVNYLSGLVLDARVNWKGLAEHRRHLVSALKDHADNATVAPKYEWLVSYHDWFCHSISRYPGYRRSLLIRPRRHETDRFRRFSTLLALPDTNTRARPDAVRAGTMGGVHREEGG